MSISRNSKVCNCVMESTQYQLQFDIHNPSMYSIIDHNELEVGTKYRFAFTKGTFPESVTVVKNEGDILVITNPYSWGKTWEIIKSKCEPNENIFYEKTCNAKSKLEENTKIEIIDESIEL